MRFSYNIYRLIIRIVFITTIHESLVLWSSKIRDYTRELSSPYIDIYWLLLAFGIIMEKHLDWSMLIVMKTDDDGGIIQTSITFI